MTARSANTQVEPGRADLQTFLAPSCAWYDVTNRLEVIVDYHATPEELAAIDEADRSGVASATEVEAAFKTFRTA